jgi:hypothetical protein
MPQGITSLVFPHLIARFDRDRIFTIKKAQHQILAVLP